VAEIRPIPAPPFEENEDGAAGILVRCHPDDIPEVVRDWEEGRIADNEAGLVGCGYRNDGELYSPEAREIVAGASASSKILEG